MAEGGMERREGQWTLPKTNPLNFKCGQLVCTGEFTKIYTLKHKTSGEEYILKTFSIDDVKESQVILLLTELLIERMVAHPNIISPITSWTIGTQIGVVLPLMPYLSCADVLKEKFPNGITESAMGLILTHVLAALEYLHDNGIIHRAVKGNHILINQFGVPILTGLTYAVTTVKNNAIYGGNVNDLTSCLNWSSPELLSQDGTGFKKNTDVYSLGITILELCNGVVPFAEMTPAAMLVQKLKFGVVKLWDKTQLPSADAKRPSDMEGYGSDSGDEDEMDFDVNVAPTDKDDLYANKCYSRAFHNFTNLCLVMDYKIRPSVRSLLKHRFIKTINEMGLPSLITQFDLKEPLHFQPNPDGEGNNMLDQVAEEDEPEIVWAFDE